MPKTQPREGAGPGPPLSPLDLQGIFPPIATPFAANGDLYKAKIKRHIQMSNQTALPGHVNCGSTGERVMLAAGKKVLFRNACCEGP